MSLLDYVPKTSNDWEYLDTFFGVLAGENITVIRRNVKTASINLSSRVMTLPNFVIEDKDIFLLMGSHEVSHVLNTPKEWCHDEVNKIRNSRMRTCINIVEDIRIEKIIRRKFPGFVGVYQRGYKKLLGRDFFSINHWDDFDIADRINAYAKLGSILPEKLTPREAAIYRYMASAETFADVIARSIYLYNLLTEELSKKPSKPVKPLKSEQAPTSGEEGEDDASDDSADAEYVEGEMEKSAKADAEKMAETVKTPGDLPNANKNESHESKTENELDNGKSSTVSQKNIHEANIGAAVKSTTAPWMKAAALTISSNEAFNSYF